LSPWTLGDSAYGSKDQYPYGLPMLKSPPIMGEARHYLGVYWSYTPVEGTRTSRDAKSDCREGGVPLGKPRRRVHFHHGRGRKSKSGGEKNPLRFAKRFSISVVAK